jgi:hypothetical protein
MCYKRLSGRAGPPRSGRHWTRRGINWIRNSQPCWVLQTEGRFETGTFDELTCGYVTPATVKERSNALKELDVAALEREGLLETEALEVFRKNFEWLRAFLRDAAAQDMALIIMTFY